MSRKVTERFPEGSRKVSGGLPKGFGGPERFPKGFQKFSERFPKGSRKVSERFPNGFGPPKPFGKWRNIENFVFVAFVPYPKGFGGSGNVRASFGNLSGTFRKPFGNRPETFRKLFGNLSGTSREPSRILSGAVFARTQSTSFFLQISGGNHRADGGQRGEVNIPPHQRDLTHDRRVGAPKGPNISPKWIPRVPIAPNGSNMRPRWLPRVPVAPRGSNMSP